LVAIALAVFVPLALRSRGGVAHATPIDEPLTAIAQGPTPPPLPPLSGLDLGKIGFDDLGASAPLAERRIARLTVDAHLQRTPQSILAAHKLPEAAIVLIDPQTGHVLAYASYVQVGPARDLCSEATSPAASVFKIITGAALVENAGLTPDTKQCY